MYVLFCSDPLSPRQPDEAYASEAETARACGWQVALFPYEALVRGDPLPSVLAGVPHVDPPQPAVYRGWMLRPTHYQILLIAP